MSLLKGLKIMFAKKRANHSVGSFFVEINGSFFGHNIQKKTEKHIKHFPATFQ